MARDYNRYSEAENLIYDLGVRNSRTGDLPVIESGTAEWRAWRAFRKSNGCNNSHMNTAKRFTVPTAFPPVDMADLRSQVSETRQGKKLLT